MPTLFGEKLRFLRQQQRTTQVDLASKLSLASYTHITKLEASQDAPSLALVVRIAHLFKVTTDYLLRDSIPVEAAKSIAESTAEPTTDSASDWDLFGPKLRALRLRHQLSQSAVADSVGLASRAYVSNLEAGRKAPSLDLVVRLADFFGVTTDYLLRDALPIEQEGASTEADAERE